MKTINQTELNTTLFEAYEEAKLSIIDENKNSRVCKFYSYTVSDEGSTLDAATLNIKLGEDLNKDEFFDLYFDYEENVREFKNEQEAIDHLIKKVNKNQKSTFCYLLEV